MSEESELKRIGATPQKNSGRGKFAKGDGILGNFLVDVKEYNKVYQLSRSNWAKVQTDATQAGNLDPLLKVTLRDDDMIASVPIRLIVISESAFIELQEAAAAWRAGEDGYM